MKNIKTWGGKLLAGLLFVSLVGGASTAQAIDVFRVDFESPTYTAGTHPSNTTDTCGSWLPVAADDESTVVATNSSQALLVNTVENEIKFTPTSTDATHLSVLMTMMPSAEPPAFNGDAKVLLYFNGESNKVYVSFWGGAWTNLAASVTTGETYAVELDFTPTTTAIKIDTNDAETFEVANSSSTVRAVGFKGSGLVDDIVGSIPDIPLKAMTLSPATGVYGGTALTPPTATVTDENNETVDSNNYDLVISNGTEQVATISAAGTYTFYATGKNGYSGTVTAGFVVSAATAGIVMDGDTSVTNYYATLQDAVDHVAANSTISLLATTDEKVTVSNALTVTRNGFNAPNLTAGEGYYKTETSESYVFAAQTSISTATIDAIADQTYTGSAIEPTLTVTLNNTTLVPDTDYTVAYANNTDVGQATATITGIGAYTGTNETTFNIVAAEPETLANWWDVDFSETETLTDTTAFKTNGEGNVEAYFGGVFANGGESAIVDSALSVNTDTADVDNYLEWIPVAPENRLSTNIVELTAALADSSDLADIAIPSDAQFAITATNGTIVVYNGTAWTDTGVPTDGAATAFKFVFDYSDSSSPKVDVYTNGVLAQAGIALTKAATQLNSVMFAGSGTVDNFKGGIEGSVTLLPVDVPVAKTGLFYNGSLQEGVTNGTGYTVVSGGSGTAADDYVAVVALTTGYIWSDDNTTTNKFVPWSIAPAGAVVTTGGESPTTTYYATLADAITAAASGATITLGGDAVLTTTPLSIADGKSLILDLAGHSISGAVELASAPILVTTTGNLTVTNSTEAIGSVVSTTTNSISNAGTLSLVGGNFASGGDVTSTIETAENATTTLGLGTTYDIKPTVGIPDGCYAAEQATDPKTWKIEEQAFTLDPVAQELYYNCTSQVAVVGAPAGATFYWTEEVIPGQSSGGSGGISFGGDTKPLSVSSGRKTDTLKFYSNTTNGTWHLTASVTNGNEEVAQLVATVTVKDVAAVVDGVEYTKAQLAQAVADAIANDKVLGLYVKGPDVQLAAGQTIKVKALCDRNKDANGKLTVTGPAGTDGTVYVVGSTVADGVRTYALTAETPSVMFTSADGQTVKYFDAAFKATEAGTYKLLKDIARSQLSVGVAGVTLDLNGKTFTSTATGTTAAINVSSTAGTAGLTVVDSSEAGTGAIVAPNYSAIQSGKNGSVAIEGGAISGKTVVVYTVSGGTAAISGGTFSMVGGSAGSMLNCNDSNRGTITVTGGSFQGFNPQNNTADGEGTDYVASGYYAFPNDPSSGWYTVYEAVTVTFADAKVTPPEAQVIGKGKTATEPTAPTFTGWTFEGWYTNLVAGEAWDFGDPVVEDITLTAKWTQNEYDVIWVADGVQFASNRVAHGTAMPVPAENPTKAGDDGALYTFVAWTPAQDATVTSNATYTAEFKTWTKIAVPTAVANLVYDGTEKTGVAAGAGYTLSGNTAMAAGDYTATATLSDPANTVWATDAAAPTVATNKTVAWSIAAKTLTITADAKTQVYGAEAVALTYTAEGLEAGDEITGALAREAGDNVGTYAISQGTLAAGDNYAIAFTGANYTITPATATITVAAASKTYGAADPAFVGTVAGLVNDGDLGTITYSRTGNDENVGTYTGVLTASYTANANYSVTVVPGDFTITAKTITAPTAVTGLTYTGSEQTGVAAGTGYTVTDGAKTNAGDYTATVTLNDTANTVWADTKDSAAKSINWSIAPADISEAVVTLEYPSHAATGDALKPSVESVVLDTTTLEADTDYTVSYSDNVAVGTATVTVTGKGNYTGSATATFTIIDGTTTLWWDNDFSETATLTDTTAFKTNGEGNVEANFGGVFTKAEGDSSSIENEKLAVSTGTESQDDYLTWTPVEPAAHLVTNTLEMVVTLSDYDELPADIECQTAVAATNGVLCVWNGAEWIATATAASEDEKVLKFVLDYTVPGAAKVDVYYDGAVVTQGLALVTAATRVSSVQFAGSGTVDNFRAEQVGESAATPIEVPAALEGLVYSGEGQIGVTNGTGYILSGNVATNAGAYTAIATLANGYVWSDGSTDATNIAWSIARKAASVTADDKHMVAGNADPEFTATVAGTFGTDTLTYTLKKGAAVEGGFAITATGNAEQGNYTVSYTNGTLYVESAIFSVKVGDTTIFYATLDDTLANAPDGATLALAADIANLDAAITVTNAITIDLAGHSITAAAGLASAPILVTTTGNLTVTNSTEAIGSVVSTTTNSISNAGTLSLVGGNFASGGDVTSTIETAENATTTLGLGTTYDIKPTVGIPDGCYTAKQATDPETWKIEEQSGFYIFLTSNDAVYTNDTYKGSAFAVTATVKDGTGESANVVNPDNYVLVISNATAEVESIVDAGTYTYYAIPAEGSPYTGTATAVFTVDKAAITVAVNGVGATAVYTGSAQTTNVDWTATSESGLFDDQYVVYDGEATVTGTTVGSYNYGLVASAFTYNDANIDATFEVTDAVFAITKATVEIPGNPASKTYNGSLQTAEVAESALYTVESNAGGTNVGNYDVVVALADSANYSWSDNSVEDKTLTFSITPASAAISIAGATGAVTYDGTAKSVTGYTPSSETEGFTLGAEKVSYSGTAEAAGTNVGTYPMNLDVEQFAYNDSNWNVTFTVAADGALTINKASITVAVTGTTDTSLEYNGQGQTVTVDSSKYTLGCDNPLYVADKVQRTATSAAARNVGNNYALGLVDSQFSYDDANVNATFVVTDGKFTITPAKATVTAEAKSKTYGETDPELTATVTGLKGEDAAALIAYTLSRAEGEDVGSYAITPSGEATQGNYDVVYVSANLTINKAKYDAPTNVQWGSDGANSEVVWTKNGETWGDMLLTWEAVAPVKDETVTYSRTFTIYNGNNTSYGPYSVTNTTSITNDLKSYDNKQVGNIADHLTRLIDQGVFPVRFVFTVKANGNDNVEESDAVTFTNTIYKVWCYDGRYEISTERQLACVMAVENTSLDYTYAADNCEFGGWYTDGTYTTAFTTVTGVQDIFAKMLSGLAGIQFTPETATFTGLDVTPAAVVTNAAGVTLVKNTDYTLVVSNDTAEVSSITNAGSYTYYATAIGSTSTGTVSAVFTVLQAGMTNLTITGVKEKYQTDAVAPEAMLKLGEYTLVKDTDYYVTASPEVDMGAADTYTLTFNGQGNFLGSTNVTFKVVAVDGVNPGGSDVDGVDYSDRADGKPALELDSDGFTVRFVGAADVTYTLEYIDDLALAGNDANWSAVTGSAVTPTETVLVELTDAAAYGSNAPAKRFYRIKSTIE